MRVSGSLADVLPSSFMYGGFFKNDESEQQIWDEIWILSIPAFRWFKVYEATDISRSGHTCHNVDSRYMMVIGGTIRWRQKREGNQ